MTFTGLARWNVLRHLALAALLALAPLAAFAQVATNTAPLEFTDRAEADRFHALVAELRCVKCQNQSLADSDAMIAQDLRREVLTLMRDGNSDDQVRQFLVARYGEFVLYRPQVQSSTWLLWFGPALLLIAGAWVIVVTVRRRRPRAGRADSDSTDQEW
ncbi:MAG: cytochrome c-type biogenesis protein CcmH [Pseudomonadota bacterium]|nr:cytochrome c-type biogenesis protein CcmH [Pseudomonadota bacterium]